MGNTTGVELREKSIRVGFSYQGGWVRETLDIKPTPANERYAAKLVGRVKQAIKDGNFIYSDHFPGSARAGKSAGVQTFGDMCDTWLDTKGRLATKTLNQYRNALGVWKTMFGEHTPLDQLTHAKVSAKIGSYHWPSSKLLNNYLICLRGVFTLAGREMKFDNPMDGIENSKHQAVLPDPLSLDEMNTILGWLEENCDERVWAYYEFAFLTGMRPEELIALTWGDWDRTDNSIRVERARTAGEVKPLKTYQARDVELVKRAQAALNLMWVYTEKQKDGFIFENPVTGRPWHDERSQRDHYWKPALEATRTRYRRSYQTRHTYAANALLGGINPTYVSRQMGHKNAKMLFQVYAKWIDGADRGRERAKMEVMLMGPK